MLKKKTKADDDKGNSWKDLVPVYAVIVTILYFWSFFFLFWTLPSFLNFLTWAEIANLFFYTLTVNLLESLFVLLPFAVTRLFLLRSVKGGQFVAKSLLMILAGLGSLMFANYYDVGKALFRLTWIQGAAIIALGILIGLAPLRKIPAFAGTLEEFADRLVIFLYVFIPASVVSLVVVVIRNLYAGSG